MISFSIPQLVASDGPSPTSQESSSSSANNENFDQISYIIKTIFQTGKEDAFTEQLTEFIKKKEQEIERMCNFYYQEFVQSVDQLLKVRLGTVNLRSKIVQLNSEMQEAGSKIVEKVGAAKFLRPPMFNTCVQKKEIIDYRKILLNIETAMESLQTCLFVLDVANKVNSQIENKKYYSALRMLEDLQTVHLQNVTQFTFSKSMLDFIPQQRENIREAVAKEMKEWFVSVHENTRRVGKMILDTTMARQERQRLSAAEASHDSITVSRSLDMLIKEESFASEETKVNFKPLYQCLHIHDVLGKRQVFRDDFEENRRLQANLILTSNFTINDGDIKAVEKFLYDVVGYFIIEAIVLNTTKEFRSRSSVDSLWDAANDKINRVITESLQECQNPDFFLAIKLRVVAFIHALESYGYPVNNLTVLMLSLFDRYTELMKFRCSERMVEIIEEDEYVPMIVNSPEEYEEVLSVFRIKEDKKPNMKFPRAMPFSKGFPECCAIIKDFINGFYHFAEGFEQQHNEMDDLLKKSLENLLIQTTGTTLSRKLSQSTLERAVQIMVNIEYLVLACGEFEELLVEKRASHKGKVNLQATQSFREHRISAEKKIFDLVKKKLDEIIDGASTIQQVRSSPYLGDINNFITTSISTVLSGMPAATKNFICFDACNHLAFKLNENLVTRSGKKITQQFIENFELDVQYLENFAKGLPDANVADAFTELRQLVDYLKSDNYEDYLNATIRGKKYPRVRPNVVVAILEK
ncbi:hypothetical protein HDV05_001675 [Chytridiales sp. JEL 0842]|nr:hypothetical protein HDV05_001675 [Chytridiales sp. JEL 0842]